MRMLGASLTFIILACIAAIPQQTASNTPSPGQTKAPTETDKNFAKHAAIGDAAEIQMGQLAQQKGSDADVKSFGQKMVTDHTNADQKLKAIADKEHIALATELDPPHKSAKARISVLTGSEFDRAYMLEMVQDHHKTVELFQQEASGGGDPDLKNFAAETLPILKQHLALAQQVQQKFRGKP